MKLFYWILNKIWIIFYAGESHLFNESLKNIEKTQREVLLNIVSKNADTLYGKKYGFSKIINITEFQNKVPLTLYSDYTQYIEKISQGEANVLTKEEVFMLELSSGSTAASKYIPYTKSLKEEYQRGISPWIYNLYSSHKELLWGRAYWSITPVSREKKRTEAGIPIGFEEDSQYFGFFERYILNALFAVSSEVKDIEDMENFRYVTLLFLMKEKNLTFISIWNPSFLTLLLKPLTNWADSLIDDIEKGIINCPGKLDPALKKLFEKRLGINKKRARELASIIDKFNSNTSNKISVYEAIWPKLRMISSWTDANAAAYAGELKKCFPNVEIQGKGLLATEGFVSFPIVGEEGAVLSIRSHFFEFIEHDNNFQDSEMAPKLAHELEQNKIYSVVITTSGGFYRYRLQDLIRVVGFTNGCPRIEFISKEEKISDYFGEKLNECHAADVLGNVFREYNLSPTFFMVAPEVEADNKYFYILYLELCNQSEKDDELLKKMIIKIENELRKNFHYNYCRQLGQLLSMKLFLLDGKNSGIETYFRVCQSFGQKAGDIKPSVLHTKTGWSKQFTGRFL